jgi:hypothetical protein
MIKKESIKLKTVSFKNKGLVSGRRIPTVPTA